MKTEINIFHHKSGHIEEVKPTGLTVSEKHIFKYINLNDIKIPDYLKIDGLTKEENAAVYSEYLGILTLKPQSDFVGSFIYTITKKRKELWDYSTFLSFKDLLKINYDPSKLYMAQCLNCLGTGLSCKFLDKYTLDIHNNNTLSVGSKEINPNGPYNGSFIVSKSRFLEYQKWLKKATIYILEKYTWRIGGKNNSPFHYSKDNSHIRHNVGCIGSLQERLTAYYFAQTFKDEDKIIL
ncbi:MAG: hypothetical protein KKA19_05385 [Candidatus Margulisbacteria bacterium]|nr:hypothetical protein [Candidatus Margulisiibacteriota bacterium]